MSEQQLTSEEHYRLLSSIASSLAGINNHLGQVVGYSKAPAKDHGLLGELVDKLETLAQSVNSITEQS